MSQTRGTTQRRRGGASPWVWVGAGCLLALVLGVSAVVGLGYLGYREVKQLEADMKDPAARESAALEVLGARDLPAGYHPMLAFSVPFVMRVAVLSDREPDAEGAVHGFDQRGFIYFDMIRQPGDRGELRDYFEGRSHDPSVLRDNDIRIDTGELLGRGREQLDGHELLWVASRGRVEMSDSGADGITSLVLIECGDERGRLGIWFGPDPDPDTPAAQLDAAGSPADPAALRAFMGHFSFCPDA